MAGRIAYYGNIVTNGLILDLDAAKLDSYPRTGTAWNDISGFRNNGTLTNGPTFDSGNGGSIVFDGVDDYVNSINQSISIQDNTPFSINIVFKTSITGAATLIGNWNVFVSSGWRIDINSGKLRFFITNFDGSQGRVTTSNLSYNDNKIYYLSAIYSGNQNTSGMNLYINSNLISITSTINTSPGTLTNSKITLGASQANTTNIAIPLNGSIYQTLIYNRALSSTEILQNYNATKGRYL